MSRHPAAALVVAGAAVLAAAAPALRAQDGPGGTSSVEISDEGEQVYQQICQSCHMADARGGAGAGTGIPALADNPRMADKDYIIKLMATGRGGMPWFTDVLTPEQIAAVLTHVRTEFNDFPEPVTAQEVARLAGSASAEQ